MAPQQAALPPVFLEIHFRQCFADCDNEAKWIDKAGWKWCHLHEHLSWPDSPEMNFRVSQRSSPLEWPSQSPQDSVINNP